MISLELPVTRTTSRASSSIVSGVELPTL